MTEPYKLRELTYAEASAITQAKAQIDLARKALNEAVKNEQALVNKIFGDLVGKLIEYREVQGSWRASQNQRTVTYRVQVDRAIAYSGRHDTAPSLGLVEGFLVLKNGKLSGTRKSVYQSAISEGRVTVLGDGL